MPLDVRVATTMAEAAGILSSDQRTKLLSGGTLVMRDVNEGRLLDGTLLRITDPAYRQMNTSGARIELGAGVTMAMVLNNRDLAFLHGAARSIGGPAIRQMATIGGNLFAQTPYGDFAVALLALDAQVMVQSGYGSARAMALDEFLSARERSASGLVAGIQFARPQNPADFYFRKISRVKPKGIAVMSLAAHLPNAAGRISQARVAYGAMAPTAIRARGVERALEGKTLDTDAISSEWYRREVLPVHLGRLLTGEGR